MTLLQPKPITIHDADGVAHDFTIHKLPATVGREIVATYPVANMPKIGEYSASEAIMLKLLGYVTKTPTKDGPAFPLGSKALVDNHVPDWEVLAKLEWAMLEYNVSFFGRAKTSDFWKDLAEKGRPWISQMLTAFSQQSSQTEKQPSTN